jgi:hypothetical protein
MLGRTIVFGAALALMTAGMAAPAGAQGLCSGVAGQGLCGAGIGGGLGAALGGSSGAKTGALIGGGLGVLGALQEQQRPVYQQPVYQQPVYQQPVYQQPVYQQPPRPTYRRTYRPAYDSQVVYNIQYGLLQLGYNPGPADGVYGNGTASAIQQYERDNGLLVSGQATPQLYAHMQQYLN